MWNKFTNEWKSVSQSLSEKVVLVTGGATRVGAQIVRQLHQEGARVIIHYRQSASDAKTLASELDRQCPDSTRFLGADLMELDQIRQLTTDAINCFGRLDILVNNASTYYPTPIGQATDQQWTDLFGTNARAPFFLAQAAANELTRQQGCIINLVDIHADRPNKGHPVYSMAKAANAMMVKSLARELAPRVRVNGVAPGAVLWPEQDRDTENQQGILDRIPLQRLGSAGDVAKAVLFLAQSDYITGQIIAVDGGRSTQQ